MTTATLARSSSGHVFRKQASKRRGNNPSVLHLNNSTTETRYGYLAFRVPLAALTSGNLVATAELVFYNAAEWSGLNTITVSRVTSKWSGSGISWSARPTTVGERTVTKTNAKKHTRWAVDVTDLVQAMQSAGISHGFRLSTNRTNLRSIVNRGSRAPKLVITYYVRPGIPLTLMPANNDVVSEPKPTLAVIDAETSESGFKGIQIQMSTSSSWTSPDWDSGPLAPQYPQIDLKDYPSAPAITAGQEMYWRVRLRGAGGLWSSWSAGARYVYQPLGSVVIDYPIGDVSDPTPPVSWTFAGGDQSEYQIALRRASDGVLLWTSPKVASDDTTVSPTMSRFLLQRDTAYEYEVRVWDSLPRSIVGGVRNYVSDRQEFTYRLSSDQGPVSNLQVHDLDPRPFSKLTWDSAMMDQFVIVRDGETVAVIDGPDALVDGNHFEFVDLEASPRTTHTWSVRAVLNGLTSEANPIVEGRAAGGGVWLCSPENDLWLPFIGTNAQEVGLTESGAFHRPLRARYGVYISTSLHGYSGRIQGELLATGLTGDKSGSDLRDEFLRAREELRGQRMILSLNDQAISVVAYDMNVSPTPSPQGPDEGDYVYSAVFSFFEVEAEAA